MVLKLNSRRLQKISDYSFFVTLPKIWVRAVGLDKGEPIRFSIDKNQRLVLEK